MIEEEYMKQSDDYELFFLSLYTQIRCMSVSAARRAASPFSSLSLSPSPRLHRMIASSIISCIVFFCCRFDICRDRKQRSRPSPAVLMNWYLPHPSVRMTTSIHRQLFGHTRIHHTCEDHTLAPLCRSAAPIPRYKRGKRKRDSLRTEDSRLSRLLWDWSERHRVFRVEMISIQSFPESVMTWISSSHRPTATMRGDKRPIESVTTRSSREE